ncbi:hypothetical protein [Pseudooceanicola sp.]|uniref:hypothetical protein n=1 Tax=Pseudooceanicola sp. TaxID=1914328 RepID=UPI004058CEF1
MRILILAAFVALAACTNSNDLKDPTADLGNFLLGHNVVVAPKAVKGPLSRDATKEELTGAVKAAVAERFGRYDGDNYYHLGVSIEGYNIALPGVPLVVSPKSVLIINVSVWDDAKQVKLTPEPKQITVFESFSGEVILGSGLTKSKEEQLANLAANAAKEIENFLLENREWFGPAPAPTSAKGGATVRRTAPPPATTAAPAPAPAAPRPAAATPATQTPGTVRVGDQLYAPVRRTETPLVPITSGL